MRYLPDKKGQNRRQLRVGIDVEQVCQKYGTSVLRRCRGILRDADEAQDAAQEIFVIVMQKGDQFRGDTDVGGWLYRITTNHCLNRLRSGRRRTAREQSDGAATWSGWEAPDPYLRSAARDQLDSLFRQLDTLGQSILIYRYLDGMTQEEIATVTGKSRRTVGKRLKKIDALVATSQAGQP
jgi:RNA polymerase sigma-70 factor (ECF subfamily)